MKSHLNTTLHSFFDERLEQGLGCIMPMVFRVFGSVDSVPTMDEIIEMFDEAEFEVTLETENEEDDEDVWSDLLVYESSLDGPINLFRIEDEDAFAETVEQALEPLEGQEADDAEAVRSVLESCTVAYGIDLQDEFADDENALVMCSVLAQFLAQRCDGLYLVDSEAWFNEAGEMVLEFAEEE